MVNPRCLADRWNSNMNITQHEDTWQWWNTFRANSDFNNKLSVALELSDDIPSRLEICRWQGKLNILLQVKIYNC